MSAFGTKQIRRSVIITRAAATRSAVGAIARPNMARRQPFITALCAGYFLLQRLGMTGLVPRSSNASRNSALS